MSDNTGRLNSVAHTMECYTATERNGVDFSVLTRKDVYTISSGKKIIYIRIYLV